MHIIIISVYNLNGNIILSEMDTWVPLCSAAIYIRFNAPNGYSNECVQFQFKDIISLHMKDDFEWRSVGSLYYSDYVMILLY